MANINKVNTGYILKWEGGLSKRLDDKYAQWPVPDGSGYHTNKGVTWVTFKEMAARVGYQATPKLFYEMPVKIWLGIYKIGFWDPMKGDHVNSQAIAEFLADFAYHSGVGGATIQLQQYLNKNGYSLKVDGGFGPKTLNALNELIKKAGEKKVFEGIYNERWAFLKSLSAAKANPGWFNRMADFYSYANDIIGKSAPILLFFFLVL